MQINLLDVEPCPIQFSGIEPLRLSLKALRKKFEDILAAEGFSISDLALATLRFTPDLDHQDDCCSTCHATLAGKDQEPVEYVVNYLGQTVTAQRGGEGTRSEAAPP